MAVIDSFKMKVEDIMTRAVILDSGDDTLAEAAGKMREQQTGSLLVMDGRRLVGIFTERDLLKAVAKGVEPKSSRIDKEMTSNVVTIAPDATIQEAASLMASKWIRHLPVVLDGEVLGVISQRDLTGVLSQMLAEPGSVESLEQEDLPRAQRLRRIEAGDLD